MKATRKRAINKQLDKLYFQMNDIALIEVERLARKCLNQNPKKLGEFVMAMGHFSFTDIKGETIWEHTYEKCSGFKPLDDFISEWDSILKLTGEPMRFTATGVKITDW